jgi:hypothetical protein
MNRLSELPCHVFAGGKRIATFEPQGGVFGYRLKPKRNNKPEQPRKTAA